MLGGGPLLGPLLCSSLKGQLKDAVPAASVTECGWDSEGKRRGKGPGLAAWCGVVGEGSWGRGQEAGVVISALNLLGDLKHVAFPL